MTKPRCLLLFALAVVAIVACSDASDSTSNDEPTTAATSTTSGASPQSSATAAPVTPTTRKLGTSTGVATTGKDPSFLAVAGAKATFGTLGASVYRIEVPDSWNGDLVLWAHGYRGQGAQVSVDNPPGPLRGLLIQQGYAWAASSYSENGYTPGIGADDTLALKRHFAATVGKPKRTFLVGASMGGNVVTLSLENFAGEYDGALAICGALAGEEQIDYLLSWARVAEGLTGVPIPTGSGTTIFEITATLTRFAMELGSSEAPTMEGEQFRSVMRMLTGGPRPFFLEGFKEQYQVNFAYMLLDPPAATLPVKAATNKDHVYAIEPGLGLTSEQVNARIIRREADPAARNAETHPDAVPTTGNLSDPLLTLHGTGDVFVPMSMEQSYAKKAMQAGKGDLLVQRAIRSGGHCKFSEQELTAAWNDLRTWVNEGKKPAGENVTGDLSNAGMQFTVPLRPGDPGGK